MGVAVIVAIGAAVSVQRGKTDWRAAAIPVVGSLALAGHGELAVLRVLPNGPKDARWQGRAPSGAPMA